ncbi:MAG: hypothetical protein ACE5J3_12375 [Methanosarcinales archaeon]
MQRHKEVIEKAKKYADTENLDTLGAVIDTFEMTRDKKYKSELYDIIKAMLNDIEEFDRELAEWRASRKKRL